MEVTRCGIHAFHETLGIDVDEIRFYWTLKSDLEHVSQTAYRVVVSLSAEGLDGPPPADIVWDSGKVESNAQRNIVCKPDGGFQSASFHFWKVTVWDEDGQATSSGVNEFFTAYPRSSRLLPPYSMNQTYMPHTSLIFRTWFEDEPNRWKGVWIGDSSDKPFYLRKSLRLGRKPTRAIAFASGLGHFNLSCNGTPASSHVLDPGWTNYHRTVQFVAYDLSNALKEGENVIGAHVGNGFYAGDQGDRFFWPMYEDNTYVRYGNELCFFTELHLFYEDGSRETIVSGPDWKTRKSATTLANIYASENKDLRCYPFGWDTPEFDDSDWQAANPVTGPRGKLTYQSQPPVTLHETFQPVSNKTLEPGIVVFDLGQNASIMVKVEVSGPAGAEIIIRYSESTDKDDANSLINMCYWSFVSNLFSYHTDCPQIEKFGWLEVTHLLAPTTQYFRDIEALHSKILDDIIDAQEPDGLVPTMAPEIRYMCGPLHDTITWGGAIALIPEIIKRYYGSTHVFGKLYQPCVRYMEYLRTKERQGGLIEHGLGDWGRDIAFGNHQANIETAIYYKCLRNVELMARELKLAEDEKRWRGWADRIYETYNRHLLITEKTQHPYVFYTSLDNPGIHDRTMVAQAMALQFGLVPAEHIADVQRAFLDDVADCKIRAGEIGLKWLWNTLADVDRPDIVMAMARQEEHPSYMRFLRRGETTLNEFWQDACRSKCHDMLGTIYEWFYEAVLGVKVEEDAYKTWTVKPPLKSEFNLVEGSFECPYGLIEVTFRRESEDVQMKVTVPTSTTATLLMPRDESKVEVSRVGSDGVKNVFGTKVKLLPGRYNLVLFP
ncbi:hypothetical protein ColLi_06441 [Colletotrichum liriopes]|uniref:alpha-L-rhamnosidase n=1 Tax=Colletotrichum liriopes TaxID=708192 RepID=A0AA37GP00_9PEZI|nr:hypothetical protein ColLi_06441 [Colletotrichum liriopes]